MNNTVKSRPDISYLQPLPLQMTLPVVRAVGPAAELVRGTCCAAQTEISSGSHIVLGLLSALDVECGPHGPHHHQREQSSLHFIKWS